jgi:hypothetical protein
MLTESLFFSFARNKWMRVWFLIGFVLLIVWRVVRFPLVIVLLVLISHFDIFKFLSQIKYTY